MRPYSEDLRVRVAAAVENDEGTQLEIAETFEVSLSFVSRLLKRLREAGTLAPKPHGGGPPPVLGPDDRKRLDELIHERPDATLDQLRREGGFSCSLTTIWRALRRRLTRKKKDLHAAEQDRPDVQRKRRTYLKKVLRIEPKRLVFLDETGITTAMTPAYAWAPRGERAGGSAPASWETVTLTAALRLGAADAPLVFPGATDAAAFQSYVDQVLAPTLHKGDVVVFDNLNAHLDPGASASIRRAGARVLRLPPYSPDLNPIEEMWSKVKTYLRQVAARTREDLYDAVGEALQRVTPQDSLGWFQHVGLCATHA